MAATEKLLSIGTNAPDGITKEEGKEKLEKLKEELAELQNLLYAEEKHSLLVVLQGLDGSGKDGTIKNVFDAVNPIGINVASFKKPTEDEYAHDFLWRVHAKVPAKRMITVFNRSHYEDVLVPVAHKTIDNKLVKNRYEHINAFEKLLQDTGTVILKFYLHISKDEQLKTLMERTENPRKMWKHEANDMKERELWDNYMDAYEGIFKNCSDVPWTIVPSDNNWYKEYLIALKTVEALRKLNLQYPSLQTA